MTAGEITAQAGRFGDGKDRGMSDSAMRDAKRIQMPEQILGCQWPSHEPTMPRSAGRSKSGRRRSCKALGRRYHGEHVIAAKLPQRSAGVAQG